RLGRGGRGGGGGVSRAAAVVAAIGAAAIGAAAIARAEPARAEPARAEPSDRALVVTGLALAPPPYLLDVTMHEGSHALAALLVGAEVDQLHVFPPGRDPSVNKFRFGWTYVHGLHTAGDRVAFFLAPKVTDAVMLGGFAALAFTGAWPHNRYGAVALTVLATGWWVDFSKDLVLFSHHNDVVKVFDLWGLSGWGQVPARLVYAGAVVGLGLVVAHGYVRTFDRGDSSAARVLPLVGAAF
ncbi:MAG TPA: M50 family metallopeptidase, partial [Kofleriaceae bacterium]|nr:M50 family metallopeptidase [Kofleriaceae bacterium]